MDDELKQFTRKTLIKSMLSSEEWYDKNFNVITGGAILLSITFLDKVVPYKEAVWKWTLIVSWLTLLVALVLNLISHRRSSRNQMLTINELDSDEDVAFGNAQNRNRDMDHLTFAAMSSMIAGLLFLILYCSINLYNMPDPAKFPTQEPERKGIPSYVPATPAAPKPTVQPAQASPPASPKKP